MVLDDYLRLVNALARHVKPQSNAYREATGSGDRVAESGLDSLDMVLLSVYLCEVFGIPESVGKTMAPATFGDIVTFIEAHKSRTPASVEEALAGVT